MELLDEKSKEELQPKTENLKKILPGKEGLHSTDTLSNDPHRLTKRIFHHFV